MSTTVSNYCPECGSKKEVKNFFIAAILDKSGSMSGMASEVISGFNLFLKEQQALKATPEPKVDVTLFDTKVEQLVENASLSSAPMLTNKTYVAEGGTALLDAVGATITSLKARVSKGDRVVVLITTDGQENSSHTYKKYQIKSLIEQAKSDGWEFVFIGANNDAWADAASMGITTWGGYTNSQAGIGAMYHTTSTNFSAMRSVGATADSLSWSSDESGPKKTKSK